MTSLRSCEHGVYIRSCKPCWRTAMEKMRERQLRIAVEFFKEVSAAEVVGYMMRLDAKNLAKAFAHKPGGRPYWGSQEYDDNGKPFRYDLHDRPCVQIVENAMYEEYKAKQKAGE